MPNIFAFFNCHSRHLLGIDCQLNTLIPLKKNWHDWFRKYGIAQQKTSNTVILTQASEWNYPSNNTSQHSLQFTKKRVTMIQQQQEPWVHITWLTSVFTANLHYMPSNYVCTLPTHVWVYTCRWCTTHLRSHGPSCVEHCIQAWKHACNKHSSDQQTAEPVSSCCTHIHFTQGQGSREPLNRLCL